MRIISLSPLFPFYAETVRGFRLRFLRTSFLFQQTFTVLQPHYVSRESLVGTNVCAEPNSFCPSVFEYDLNPVIHRPYVNQRSPVTIPILRNPISQSFQLEECTGTSSKVEAQRSEARIIDTDSSSYTLPAHSSSTDANSSNTSPSDLDSISNSSPPVSPGLCQSSHLTLAISSQPSRSPPITPRTFPCDSCAAAFDQRYELKYVTKSRTISATIAQAHHIYSKHISRIHNKRFRCSHPNCTQAPFGFEADLRRHVLAKHNGAGGRALYKCEFEGCNEVFSRKDNMRRHARLKHERW